MAKEKEFTFDDLNASLSKSSIFGETMDKSVFSKIDEYIGTGNYLLNACISGSLFGGVPNNRSVCYAGPSGTGKTFLLLNNIRMATQMGYTIIFYDSETAVDTDLIQRFGIDPKKLRYEPCNTVQEFRTSITTLTKTISEQKRKGLKVPKVMVCLDSLGNLASQKEIDDALSGSEKADMTRAKTIKSLFRILGTQLAECKIPFIFTNHTYSGQSFIPIVTAGGGTGPEYFASIILFLRKAQLKENQVKSGIIMTATPNKNRFAKPTPVKVIIHFDKGMNAYMGLHDFISWESCGIAKGNIFTEKQYEKWTDKEKADAEKFDYRFTDPNGKVMYFYPNEKATKWCVRHTGEKVGVKELFTKETFTDEVLLDLDEKVIKPMFNYGVNNENLAEELNSIMEADEEEQS
jgi:RecA/RadA recombinase